jgi:hypothetical protein
MVLRFTTTHEHQQYTNPLPNPHFSQRFVYEATKMPAKSAVGSENKRGILDSMLSAIFAETSFAAAFSKP